MAQEGEMIRGTVKSSNETPILSSSHGGFLSESLTEPVLVCSDSLAPSEPRSLRSKKREGPSDEISHATLNDQDTERNVTAVDTELPQYHQYHQSHIQESNMTSAPRHQAAEQSCLAEHGPATEETHAEATEGFMVHVDDDASLSGRVKEEIKARECNGSPSQTCTDQLQVLLLPPEENGSCAMALEEQRGVENSQCNLEKEHETSHVECSNTSTTVKEVRKEAEGLLPAKKKRRMGMCGLTGKERSYFLQTQKGENGQNRWERADLKPQEEIIASPPLSSSISFPAGSVSEQKEAEAQLQSSHSEGDDRSETEVHIAVTTSDETSALCDPGCSNGRSCDAKEGIVPVPEQNGDTKLDPPAEDGLLGNQEQHELEARTAQSVARKPQQQLEAAGDESAVVDRSPAISSDDPAQSKKTENWDAIEAASLQVMSVTRTRAEKKEALMSDAGGVASSTDSWSGGLSCGRAELCEAAVSPSGSVEKHSWDEPGAGPSTLNAEQHQIRNTSDPFGSGCLDYVSDSQLNTIILTEEEVLGREEDLSSTECHDATDLICGLIRELSSLNRRVMSTHRELETVRRGNKSSRNFTR